jgi:Na+/alanine symporter
MEVFGVKVDRDLRRVVVALVGALVAFCVVALVIYYKMADVKVNGFVHGGPATLAAAMAGLFGGGLVAVVVLILLLRLR